MTEGAFTAGSPAESDEYLAAVRGDEEGRRRRSSRSRGTTRCCPISARGRLYSTLDLDSYVEFDLKQWSGTR